MRNGKRLDCFEKQKKTMLFSFDPRLRTTTKSSLSRHRITFQIIPPIFLSTLPRTEKKKTTATAITSCTRAASP